VVVNEYNLFHSFFFLPREIWDIEELLVWRVFQVSLANQGHGGQRERRVTED